MALATPPLAPAALLTADRQQVVKAALDGLAARAARYRLYADYYEGRHRLQFASIKFEEAFGSLFREFADNLCRSVVDAVADRLTILGFDQEGRRPPAAGTPANPADPVDQAWALWRTARLQRIAGQLHQDALAHGDAYLIVWPEQQAQLPGAPQQPIFFPQVATSMTVRYDEARPGAIAWAAKWWRSADKFGYLTLYYADRLEKYRTRTTCQALPRDPKSWLPLIVEGEDWPLANPYDQVPVFHFAPNAPIGGFGTSELADVIPLQNALNKTVADLLVAMEFHAVPQRYATGISNDSFEERDPITGKSPSPFEPGGLWTVAAEAARFGEFAPAELTALTKAKEEFQLDIARVSRTPIHHLLMTGVMPSGESLKTAEAPFVKKVADRQLTLGDTWAEAMTFALKVLGVPLAAPLYTLWADPSPRGDKDHVETLVIKRGLGVSEAQVLSELGYTEQKIEEMRAERSELDVIPATEQ